MNTNDPATPSPIDYRSTPPAPPPVRWSVCALLGLVVCAFGPIVGGVLSQVMFSRMHSLMLFIPPAAGAVLALVGAEATFRRHEPLQGGKYAAAAFACLVIWLAFFLIAIFFLGHLDLYRA